MFRSYILTRMTAFNQYKKNSFGVEWPVNAAELLRDHLLHFVTGGEGQFTFCF